MLDNWRQKLTNLGADQQLKVLLMGDSGLAGMWATNHQSSIAGLLYSHFADKYSPTAYTIGAMQPEATELPKEWNYVKLGGEGATWEAWPNMGSGYAVISLNSTAEIVQPFTGIGFKLYVVGWPYGATMRISVDGGAETTFKAGSNDESWQPYLTYTSPVYADGNHTATIRVSGTGDSGVALYAFEVIQGTGHGVQIHNLAIPGTISSTPLAVQNTAGKNLCMEATIDAFDPDLVVICYGGNDILNSRTPQSLKDNLTQIADYIHNRDSTTDIVFMSYGIIDNNPTGYQQAEYSAAIAEAAAANNAPFLDFASEWSDNFTLNNEQSIAKYGWISGDKLHANDSGHAEIARRILEQIDIADTPEPTDGTLKFVVLGSTAPPTQGEPMTVYIKYSGEGAGVYIAQPDGAVVKIAGV